MPPTDDDDEASPPLFVRDGVWRRKRCEHASRLADAIVVFFFDAGRRCRHANSSASRRLSAIDRQSPQKSRKRLVPLGWRQRILRCDLRAGRRAGGRLEADDESGGPLGDAHEERGCGAVCWKKDPHPSRREDVGHVVEHDARGGLGARGRSAPSRGRAEREGAARSQRRDEDVRGHDRREGQRARRRIRSLDRRRRRAPRRPRFNRRSLVREKLEIADGLGVIDGIDVGERRDAA